MHPVNTVEFFKVIPSGNPTILLEANTLTKENLPAVAAELMHPMHLQAEQVGRLDFGSSMPHLQMMGGEFCVNATRGAAALLAQRGLFSPSCKYPGCLEGVISVSGASTSVPCLVTKSYEVLIRSIMSNQPAGNAHFLSSQHDKPPLYSMGTDASSALFQTAALINFGEIMVEKLATGVTLVKLTGITHLLLDETVHPMPKNWRMETAAWRVRYHLEDEPACGVIWYKKVRNEYNIRPAVFVAATGSEHMETACGSGSLALAIALTPHILPMSAVALRQPSREQIYIVFTSHKTAWIVGNVFIAAQGTAYLSRIPASAYAHLPVL